MGQSTVRDSVERAVPELLTKPSPRRTPWNAARTRRGSGSRPTAARFWSWWATRTP